MSGNIRRASSLCRCAVADRSRRSVFSAFTAKLSSEARELKERLERERREARRLSSVVTEQAAAEQALSRRLAETEQAKREAADELMRVVAIRDQLQSAHDGLLSALRDESFLASALSSRADTDATSILSARSRPGPALGHIDDGTGEDDELARQRTALVETMRHLSERVGILTPPASIGRGGVNSRVGAPPLNQVAASAPVRAGTRRTARSGTSLSTGDAVKSAASPTRPAI